MLLRVSPACELLIPVIVGTTLRHPVRLAAPAMTAKRRRLISTSAPVAGAAVHISSDGSASNDDARHNDEGGKRDAGVSPVRPQAPTAADSQHFTTKLLETVMTPVAWIRGGSTSPTATEVTPSNDSVEARVLPPVRVRSGAELEREQREFLGIDLMKYWENDFIERQTNELEQRLEQVAALNELYGDDGGDVAGIDLMKPFDDDDDRPVMPLSISEQQRRRLAEMRGDVEEVQPSVPRLSHVDPQTQRARMVDVSEKLVTHRTAEAECRVVVGAEVFRLLVENRVRKGDALAVAQLAGVMAAKRTAELIPLCHNIVLSDVQVELELCATDASVRVHSAVSCDSRTGAEMEALTAACVAALTVYDMCKSASKSIAIKDVRLVSKSGGVSGDYTATRKDGAKHQKSPADGKDREKPTTTRVSDLFMLE